MLGLAGMIVLVAVAGAQGQPVGAQQSLDRSLTTSMRNVGGASSGYVVDLTAHRVLYSLNAGVRRLPASVEKIYTTSTALLRFGPNASLTTSIYGFGKKDTHGVWHGTIYLRGGGDPTFGSSSFDAYAYGGGATMQRLVANLIHATGLTGIQGHIVADGSYFDGLRGTVATGYVFTPDLEGVLSGLIYNRGLANQQGTAFQNHPAFFAAQQFVTALRAAGLAVPKNIPLYASPTPPQAQLLAQVHSPRIATLIQWTNTPSDNFFAEMLLKGIGARFGGAGTSAAGAGVVRAEIAHVFGIHPRLDDGSGLSRDDATSPVEVVTALTELAANRPFVNSLAVAGVSGTLAAGLYRTYAQGRCQGKTGTLSDVANLVGYCTAHDGHRLAFAFLLNQVDPTYGHSQEDQMAVALARYTG
jgi:D-alanyl-D-alanine carboxypeptidase/D-alanyl-D-alanine-endopeptidase (penicillin-binding protein 4)